jgi:hypothetical protein
MGVPLLAAYAVNQARERSGGAARFVWNGRLALIPLAVLGGFVAGMPYAVLGARRFVGDFIMLNFYQESYGGAATELGFGPHVANLLEIFGPFLFILALGGLVHVTVRGWRERSAGVLVLLVAVATVFLKMGSMHFHPQRYIMPLVPLLAIGAGKLASDLLGGVILRPLPRAVPAIVLGLGVALTFTRTVAGLLDIRSDDRELAQQWVVEHVDKRDSVEMVRIYGINVPEGFENFGTIPYRFHKDTFDRMRANSTYRESKALFPWVQFDDERTRTQHQAEDATEFGLGALLKRCPKYLILAERCYERFLTDQLMGATNYPLQSDMYRAIIEGRTPYRLAADFRKKHGFLRPKLEFINSGVTIYRHLEWPCDASSP